MKTYKMTTKKVNQKTNKNYWLEIGTIFVNDQGQISGYLNNNPDVQVYLFENQPKQQNAPQTNAYQNQSNPGQQSQPYQQPQQQQPGNIQFSDPTPDSVPF
jgi:hypothetical protein